MELIAKGLRTSAEFVYLMTITVVVVGLALYIINTILDLAPIVLLVLSAGIGWTLVPTFIAVWMSLYSPQARMVAEEFMLTSRLRHYRLLNNHFFSRLEDFKEKVPPGSQRMQIFHNYFGADWDYSVDKMSKSLMYDEGISHLTKDYGQEIVTQLFDLHKQTMAHEEKLYRFHTQVSELLVKRFADEGIQVKGQGNKKDSIQRLQEVQSLDAYCDMLADTWYSYFNFKQDSSDLPSERILAKLNGIGSTLESKTHQLVQLASLKIQPVEKVERVLSEVADDKELVDKLRHLFISKEEMYERAAEVESAFDKISKRIQGELYSSVTNCCPYRRVDL